MLLVVLSVSAEIRRILPTALHSFNLPLPGPPARWVFWVFFSFYENNGMQKKSFKNADRQIWDWSPFSSNYLVIGSGFHFPTIALAGGEEDRCGSVGTSFLQAGCALGPGGRSLLAGL